MAATERNQIRAEISLKHLGANGSIRAQRHSTESQEGRTIAVTGGNSGLGEAFAERVAIAGANLLITGRNEERLERTARRLRTLGVDVYTVAGDVKDQAMFDRMGEVIEGPFGGELHGAFSNAGLPLDKELLLMKPEEFMEVVDVHLGGTFRLAKVTVPALRKGAAADEYATFVINSSISAKMGTAGQPNYAAAKAGAEALGRNMANENAAFGIAVNSVEIGPADTGVWERPTKATLLGYRREFGRDAAEVLGKADPLVAIKRRMPLAGYQLMPVVRVAGVIAQLFSRDAAMITGQTIPIDAGFTLSHQGEIMTLTNAYEQRRLADLVKQQPTT